MGLTPTASAAFMLGDRLRQGISGLADEPLKRSQFDFDKSRIQYGLNRQSELDKLQRPGLELNAQVAQNQMDEANQPVYMSMLMPDVNAVGHWLYQEGDEGDESKSVVQAGIGGQPMIRKFADMWGGHWDLDPKSPTRGQLLLQNGKPVTLSDLHRNAGRVQAFIRANTGLEHSLDDMSDRLQRNLMAGKITKDQYAEQAGRLEQIRNSPEMQMKIAQDNIDFLSQFGNQGNPLFQSEITRGIQRWQAKYDSAQKAMTERNLELQKQGFTAEQNRLNRQSREKIAADKLKSDDAGRKYSDRLSQQKYEAQAAFLKGEATPEQIRIYNLDNDVYLAQAMKMVNEEQSNLFPDERLSPQQQIDQMISYAEQMRNAAIMRNKKNDPLGIRGDVGFTPIEETPLVKGH